MKTVREDKVRTLRIVRIDEFIRTGSYPSVQKLMKEFETSRSTIMRDLEFLRSRYDAPIEFSKERKGYYYTDPSFFIKSVMLTEGELFTISTIMPLLEQYRNTPIESSFRNIIRKLSGMLPSQIQIDSSFLSNDIQFISDPLPEIDSNVFNTIFEAIKRKCSVRFRYRSLSRTEYSSRTIDPYKVICQKGNWYTAGYNHDHGEFRVYALSRMKDIKILEPFEFDPEYEDKIHIDESFGVWNNSEEPKKIEILFASTINTLILERTWHSGQECHQNEDGTVYLTFESNQMQETLYWILHFGSDATVLNPPELKEMVRKELEKTLAKYAQ